MSVTDDQVSVFAKLFSGRANAFGTGAGRWVKEPLGPEHYRCHLNGMGEGLGVAPLRDDGTVSFAAIDLDAPNFDAAREMSKLLPGTSFVERSRSGNAHVWAFFASPIEGWVPRGIMREVLAALGMPNVEVFPKQDRLLPGMFGNYINLPYFGDTRPVLYPRPEERDSGMPLEQFVTMASTLLNDPDDWRKRARWLGIPSPDDREAQAHREHGTQPYLHMCAEHIIEHREDNPVREGHRAVVYFNLSKQLTNCSMFDHDEALEILALVNDASPDPISSSELNRILANAERGQFTSTGCDDPLFAGIYSHPDCPIANGKA